MSRPSTFNSGTTAFTDLTSIVSPGHYCAYTTRESVPAPLRQFVQIPADNFRGVMVLSALSSQRPPLLGGVTPASTAPVYRVRTVRWDAHDGVEHFNADDVLLFHSNRSVPLQVTARQDGEHYVRLSRDSGLDGVYAASLLPREPRGTISSLGTASAWTDFSTGRSSR